MKNSYSNRPCKSSDDFEIALHLFQEYANSLEFRLCFQGFDQELEFLLWRLDLLLGLDILNELPINSET